MTRPPVRRPKPSLTPGLDEALYKAIQDKNVHLYQMVAELHSQDEFKGVSEGTIKRRLHRISDQGKVRFMGNTVGWVVTTPTKRTSP